MAAGLFVFVLHVAAADDQQVFRHDLGGELDVILLHGYGGSADSFISMLDSLATAELIDTAVALRAPHALAGRGYSWFSPTGGWRPDQDAELVATTRAQLKERVDALIDGGLIEEPIAVIGFSEGGAATYALNDHPAIAHFLVLGGYVPTGVAIAPHAPPIDAQHGREDTVVVFGQAEAASAAAEEAGRGFRLVPIDGMGHSIHLRGVDRVLRQWVEGEHADDQ